MIRLIAPIISAIIASFVFSIGRREARKAEAAMDKYDFVVRLPKANLVLYIIVTVFFSFAYLVVLVGDLERWLINFLAMSPFLALGPFLIAISRRWKIAVKGNQITATPYFGKEKTFAFGDITDVKSGIGSGNIEYIEAYSEKKKVFRVTGICLGFQVLAQRLKDKDLPIEGRERQGAEGSPEEPPKALNTKRSMTTIFTWILIGILAVGIAWKHKVNDGGLDSQKKAAAAAWERGMAAEDKNYHDKAIAEYTEAIRLDSNNSDYYSFRAQIYKYEKKDYDKAIADYTEAIRLGDNNVDYYARGDCYFEKGDYAKATADYEEALKRKPDDSGVKDKLARAKKQVALEASERSRESIHSVIMQNIVPLRDAYNQRLLKKPGLAGKITVKLAIDEFGKVVSARVVESTINDKELEKIVASKAKEWNFGKIDKPGDTTRVSFPFKFEQGDSL